MSNKSLGKERCELQVRVSGMDCAACAGELENYLERLQGVEEAKVRFTTEKVAVVFDEKETTSEKVKETIRKLGYRVQVLTGKEEGVAEEKGDRYLLEFLRLGLVAILILLSWAKITLSLPFSGLSLDLAIPAVFIGGYPLLKESYYSLRARNLSANVLMSMAIIGAFLIGEFLSAAVVAFFMLIAEVLEEFTIERSRKAIRDLIEVAPKKARVLRGGEEKEVPAEEISHKDIVIVRSGEEIPVDGQVIKGQASVNQASITGESVPVEKHPGEEVFAGTINELGVLKVSVGKVGKETTLGRIIELVEEAQDNKAPVQKVADKFTNYFAPLVLGITVLTYLVTGNPIAAITVLIVACPCAVALATPLAVVAGIGKASRRGILIKGGIYLETLGQVENLVLDKTGTLTLGEPKVTEIKAFGEHDEKEIIALAATAEKHSEHLLAKAIMAKADEYKVEVPDPENFQVLPGQGVLANYDGQRVIMGRRKLLLSQGVKLSPVAEEYMREKENRGETAMLVAHDGEVCGVVCVADILRQETKKAIDDLKKLGFKRLIMLTGDNPRTARAVASELGIDQAIAEMLPEDKVEKVKELVARGEKIAMVGDGINDAPALAQASVGIAMGSAGTDAAIEASHVALMTDDLSKLREAIIIGRKTFGTIKQNLVTGILFNVVGIALAATGVLSPIAAAGAHVLPEVLVFANSARLFR